MTRVRSEGQGKVRKLESNRAVCWGGGVGGQRLAGPSLPPRGLASSGLSPRLLPSAPCCKPLPNSCLTWDPHVPNLHLLILPDCVLVYASP